jgi:hypothetical protein
VEFARWPSIRRREDPTDRLTASQPRALAMVAARPAEVRKCPEGTECRYAAVPTGGRALWMAIVPGEGAAATVAFDRDGDGDLLEEGDAVTATGTPNGAGTLWATRWQVGSATLEVAAMRTPGKDAAEPTWMGGTNVTGARRGVVDVAGVRHVLHLHDRDFDGTYTGAEDRWWFGPAAQVGKIRELSAASMTEGTEPVFAPDAWKLQSVAPDGTARVVRAEPSENVGAYFARRSERTAHHWFPQFDREAAAFAAKQGIDLARPKATKPVAWMHDVDLRAALARAAREGKPLLVDFEADWCQWCYRFEYYLYRDAEVAGLVSQFVPLKVNYEFHTAGEFERLKAPRSLPVIFFLDEKGAPVTFSAPGKDGKPESTFKVGSFQTPQAFAATLRTALDAWRAGRASAAPASPR